jgi:NAD(P)-dependent dehydrogenase (short-subunit alcohol dehydrogenase family)
MTGADEGQNMDELAGKVAIVTGGSQGIGLAAAHRLARGGAAVALCGIDQESVDAAVAGLRADGARAVGWLVDVVGAAAVEQFVRRAAEALGGPDILVNSAGIQRYGSVVTTDEQTWDRVLDVNLKGAYLAAKHAIPHMARRGGGAIVNVASVQAYGAQAGVAAYAASKGGLVALTRAMAVDHAADGIRVNAVCPGSVETPMLTWAAEKFRGDRSATDLIGDWGRMHPLGRVAQPEEVAELIAFLAGPRASFITGGDYRVDGGLMATIAATLPD